MTHCSDLIYTAGFFSLHLANGPSGCLDVCETWCRDGGADVPLLADVQGRIPERMT